MLAARCHRRGLFPAASVDRGWLLSPLNGDWLRSRPKTTNPLSDLSYPHALFLDNPWLHTSNHCGILSSDKQQVFHPHPMTQASRLC